MFVARSAARVRLARLAFLVVCLAPTVALVGVAVHRRSDAYRATVERRWREAVGVPLQITAVEHPRPGLVRLHGCLLPAAAGRPALDLPVVEVESSADEDRVRLPDFACDPGSAAVLADVAGRWIADDVRFPRTCIVEVGDFRWVGADPAGGGDSAAVTPLRVECVTRAGMRAVRVVRQGDTVDELRVVRHMAQASAVRDRIEVTIDCPRPIPLAVAVAAVGGESAVVPGAATVCGTLEAVREAQGWRGTARGRIAAFDLAGAAAALGGRGAGMAEVEIARISWSAGRIGDAVVECTAGPGWIDSGLFDRIVLALAARPGPAVAGRGGRPEVSFDQAACLLAAGPQGIQIMPATRLPGRLAEHRGLAVLEPPVLPVPGDRVAWLLASPGTAFGPAAGPGAWLMSVLPESVPPAAAGNQRRF